jgi:RHS repeat-associated protein
MGLTQPSGTATTVTGARIIPLPSGGDVVRTGATTSYYFEIPGQQGTNGLYLDHTAQTPAWRQFTPYGAPRGAAVTWIDNRGFLNKPADPDTGLTYIGARAYNPQTSQFISPDPVLTPANPQDLNPYDYAQDNPITSSDPTGMIRTGPPGSTCTTGTEYEKVCGGNGNPDPTNSGTGGGSGGGYSSGGSSAPIVGGAITAGLNALDGILNDSTHSHLFDWAGSFSSWWNHTYGIVYGSSSYYTERLSTAAVPIAGSLIGIGDIADAGLAADASDIGGFATLERLLLGEKTGPDPAPEAGTLRFTQTTASATFKNGSFAGRTIGDIAGALRSGAVKPSEMPVGTITRDGNPLILNTRSSLALLRGGINPADWTINDMTGDPFYEELLTQRLAKNGLTNEGADVLRITGAGRWASWLG